MSLSGRYKEKDQRTSKYFCIISNFQRMLNFTVTSTESSAIHLVKGFVFGFFFSEIHLALTSKSGEPTTCNNILLQQLFIFLIKVARFTFKPKLFS